MDHEHVRVGFGRGGTGASSNNNNNNNNKHGEEDIDDLRRGPWTVEEDFTLINYVAHHGEGRWNSLARCAGLKRTGKSCRLRWLNYLRPDVRRGNITLEEQLMILELHSRWGNRWSKIAQHLPGRTDNEIKNYWRTRVQKHAKQLKCDVNSKQFKDTMRYLWMPRLVERIQAAAAAPGTTSVGPTSSSASASTTTTTTAYAQNHVVHHQTNPNICTNEFVPIIQLGHNNNNNNNPTMSFTPENSSTGASSDNSFGTQVSPVSDCCYNYLVYNNQNGNNTTTTTNQDYYQVNTNNNQSSSSNQLGYGESLLLTSPTGYFNHGGLDFQPMDQQNSQWNMDGGDVSDSLWNVEDVWFLQQQLNNNSNVV